MAQWAAERYGKHASRIEGLQAARKAFAAIEPAVRERILKATEETCIAIRNRAVATVPVRHGYLRAAITWSVSQKSGEGRVGLQRGTRLGAMAEYLGAGHAKVQAMKAAHVKGLTNQSARIHKYASGRTAMMMPSAYAHLVEFGTNVRRTKTGASRGAITKRPNGLFMLPAAEAEKNNYLERCKAQGKQIERDLSVGRFQ